MSKYSEIVKTDAELKPCPFCGGEAELIDMSDAYESEYWVAHQCPNGTSAETYSYETEAEAIEAWNTRATPKNSEDTPNFAYGNDAVYWHDEYEKLLKAVEVIRDATERTCKVDHVEFYPKLGGVVVTWFDCGHAGRGTKDWFNYCPECGAKVVHKTEKVWCDYDKETPVYTNGRAKVVEE